jgi:hypothetical protein
MENQKKPNIVVATIGVTIVVLSFVYLLSAYVFGMWPFREMSEQEAVDLIMHTINEQNQK